MSFVSNILNPSQGAGFQASGANLIQPTTKEQADNSYFNSQNALNRQSSFLDQLSNQNGVLNQSNVFNQQQQLANQLSMQAQGQGPNPAQAQLAQNTANNTSNQAALMAGQRGSGANAGMIARQAAQQGGANQQAMVGQAATLQAQQQLAAQQALMQQQAQMGGLATNQVGQLSSGINAANQAQQGEQGLLLGGINNQNNSNVAMQSNMNNANAGIAQGNQKTQAGLFTGALGGVGQMGQLMGNGSSPMVGAQSAGLFAGGAGDAGGLASMAPMMAMAAHGGMIPHYDDGGRVRPSPSPSPGPNLPGAQGAQQGFKGYSGFDKLKATLGFADGGEVGPKSHFGQFLKGYSNQKEGLSQSPGLQNLSSSGGFPYMSQGGKVPAMVSPGERYLPPKEVKKVEKGEKSPMHAGKKIPGKAEVKGDSLKNDKVSATLDEGGIVIPRSIMQSKDPEKKAHDFISQVLARQGIRGKK